MTLEFQAWPKTPRLFRDAVITEKIDGTNAAVIVVPVASYVEGDDVVSDGATAYRVGAQSRNRLVTPEADNMGFARWVRENQWGLAMTLGPGHHYGEWWGSGIQRGYGLTNGDKRFSLFNVHRYSKVLTAAAEGHLPAVPGLGVVPVLDSYTFSTERVREVLERLRETGSQAAPGFMRPEGVVVFHSQSRSVYKALLENDDIPKGAV